MMRCGHSRAVPDLGGASRGAGVPVTPRQARAARRFLPCGSRCDARSRGPGRGSRAATPDTGPSGMAAEPPISPGGTCGALGGQLSSQGSRRRGGFTAHLGGDQPEQGRESAPYFNPLDHPATSSADLLEHVAEDDLSHGHRHSVTQRLNRPGPDQIPPARSNDTVIRDKRPGHAATGSTSIADRAWALFSSLLGATPAMPVIDRVTGPATADLAAGDLAARDRVRPRMSPEEPGGHCGPQGMAMVGARNAPRTSRRGHYPRAAIGCLPVRVRRAGAARRYPDADQAARLNGSRVPDRDSPTPEQGDLCLMGSRRQSVESRK
jgi:hypothetical protein